MEDEPQPVADFAVYQNSRTRKSAIWTKDLGRWHSCRESEYQAIDLIVTLLRNSPNPHKTMEAVAALLQIEGEQGNDLIE